MNMKSTLLFLIALGGLLAGCSRNSLDVVNGADEQVIFHFRGETYRLATGATQTIEEIPNGTWTYSTTFGIPAGMKGVAGEGLSGQMTFSKGTTRGEIMYSSFIDMADTSYVVGAATSSTERVETSAALGTNP
jgi:hypothetical protein